MPEEPGFGPLKGLTIVDLSMWWSGPLATQLFALMGARVIKVESIQRVDGWRAMARTGGDSIERAPNFNGVNLNKLGITLDLSSERGREILGELVAGADALVENYSPRVMDNLGLDDDTLRGWKSDLVILSMPGFGLAGPWRDYVGFAPTIEQMSGLPELVGYAGGPPSLSGNSLADPIAGYTGCLALLAALHERERTGQGQHVDLSQLEALTSLLGYAFLSEQFNGAAPPRVGNALPGDAPRGCYPSLGDDRWVTVSVHSDGEFRSLCSVIGRPELAADVRFATRDARIRHRDEVDALVAEWTASFEALEAATILQAGGVTAGPVLGPAGLLADPHLKERGYWRDLDRAVVGRHPHPGVPFKFSVTPGLAYESAPTLGRDNRKVLGDLLGMDDAALAKLEADHVIGTTPL
jgi:crotonobetainyl-CoA:carnitine CoA-transferase CaiB-like acyl-CoA transferase